jgi:hypothetical protein
MQDCRAHIIGHAKHRAGGNDLKSWQRDRRTARFDRKPD